MKLKPLYDRVIIKRLDPDTVSKGGILIPDAATEKPERGEVLAVGPGKREESVVGGIVPLSVNVGDKVLFGKYSGQTVNVSGEELLIMREEDILAVVC